LPLGIDATLSFSRRRARWCGSRKRRSGSRGGHSRDGMVEEDRTEMVHRRQHWEWRGHEGYGAARGIEEVRRRRYGAG
jgi:hypothetical protein